MMSTDELDDIESEAFSDMLSKPTKPVRFPRIQSLRDERGNKCKVCESTSNLEFAHIKPTELRFKGRGQTQRYYDIKRNPESYELLCKKCHGKFDRGEIEL